MLCWLQHLFASQQTVASCFLCFLVSISNFEHILTLLLVSLFRVFFVILPKDTAAAAINTHYSLDGVYSI